MAERVIVWTKTAIKQRREILKYWQLKNKSFNYPEKIIRLTRKRISIILKNPLAFKTTNFLHTRESAMGYFSIYYKITDTQLIITAFWDNRQDPKILISLL